MIPLQDQKNLLNDTATIGFDAPGNGFGEWTGTRSRSDRIGLST
jgi:hypothetical protein